MNSFPRIGSISPPPPAGDRWGRRIVASNLAVIVACGRSPEQAIALYEQMLAALSDREHSAERSTDDK